MKTENELNNDIFEITLLIQKKYPELLKYINEFPVTNPNKKNPEINVLHLTNYYNSLNNMVKKYAVTHL
jgi:hypothetical protein